MKLGDGPQIMLYSLLDRQPKPVPVLQLIVAPREIGLPEPLHRSHISRKLGLANLKHGAKHTLGQADALRSSPSSVTNPGWPDRKPVSQACTPAAPEHASIPVSQRLDQQRRLGDLGFPV